MFTKSDTALQQLEELRKKCVAMGVIIGSPAPDTSQNYFTATVPEHFSEENIELFAETIQQSIALAAKIYPDVVFYRFDSFSSLLYVI